MPVKRNAKVFSPNAVVGVINEVISEPTRLQILLQHSPHLLPVNINARVASSRQFCSLASASFSIIRHFSPYKNCSLFSYYCHTQVGYTSPRAQTFTNSRDGVKIIAFRTAPKTLPTKKGADIDDVTIYRPMSNLHTISKIFE